MNRSQCHQQPSCCPAHLGFFDAAGGGNAVVQAALDVLENEEEFATVPYCLQELHQMPPVRNGRGRPHLWKLLACFPGLWRLL